MIIEKPDWLTFSNVANASSLLSLIVTGITLWLVSKIEKAYLTQARLPQVLRQLDTHRTKLSSTIGRAPGQTVNRVYRHEVVAYLETLVAAKRICLRGDGRDAVKREIKKVREWDKKPNPTADDDWKIFDGVAAVKTALSHMQRDAKGRAR